MLEPTPVESEVESEAEAEPDESEPEKQPSKNEVNSGENLPLAPKSRPQSETPWDITVFLGTPLGQSNLYDQSFSTFAAGTLLSFPVKKLQPRWTLFGSAGVAVTFSSLTLTQPTVSFSHWYFHFPALIKLQYLWTRTISLEGFAGLAFRPWEYDSRPTVDGGFHGTQNVSIIQPEFGIAGIYHLSSGIHAKLSISFLWLSLGATFLL